MKKIIIIAVLCALVYLLFMQDSNSPRQSSSDITSPETASYIREKAIFERIVDGDTIIVNLNDERERVRLIGVDTPESVGHREQECFGDEASSFLEGVMKDTDVVSLEFDDVSGFRDKHGRILAYVFYEDVFLNREIIERGYGEEYTYRGQEYKYQDDLKAAERQARNLGLGLWDASVCQK